MQTVEAFFNLTRTYWKRGNEVFICSLSIALFRILFCKWKLGGHQFFQFFKIFFKVEATFPYSGKLFFNILQLDIANGFS